MGLTERLAQLVNQLVTALLRVVRYIWRELDVILEHLLLLRIAEVELVVVGHKVDGAEVLASCWVGYGPLSDL